MRAARRHNVRVLGRPDGPAMVFAHGFGCDQGMWRFVWPAFAASHRVVLLDHVGHGGASAAGYDRTRHAALDGFASDVLDVLEELELEDVVFVGHSVSAMIGALAAIREPSRFSRLVMVSPSPRYVDDGDYVGGFTAADIDGLLEALDSNYLGWSADMAPVIMGNDDRPELAAELAESFCATDAEVAKRFARVTFLSDNREDLSRVPVPVLVLQCSVDAIAPPAVGRYVHERLPDSRFVMLQTTGHCPNLSAPDATVAAIGEFVAG